MGIESTSIKTILIDADTARKMLCKNYEGNRRIRKSAVSKYVAEMKSGSFMTNVGQIIVLHRDGTLLDGQHRLTAVVESDTEWPFVVQVVSGDKAEIYSKIDQGGKRSLSDCSQMNKNQAGIARIIAAVKNGKSGAASALQAKVTNRRQVTNTEAIEVFSSNPLLIEYADAVSTKLGNSNVRGSRIGAGAFAYIASEMYGRAKVDKFIDNIADPTLCECPQAAATLAAINSANNSRKRGTLSPYEMFGFLFTGFNYMLNGGRPPRCFNKIEKHADSAIEKYRSIYCLGVQGGD